MPKSTFELRRKEKIQKKKALIDSYDGLYSDGSWTIGGINATATSVVPNSVTAANIEEQRKRYSLKIMHGKNCDWEGQLNRAAEERLEQYEERYYNEFFELTNITKDIYKLEESIKVEYKSFESLKYKKDVASKDIAGIHYNNIRHFLAMLEKLEKEKERLKGRIQIAKKHIENLGVIIAEPKEIVSVHDTDNLGFQEQLLSEFYHTFGRYPKIAQFEVPASTQNLWKGRISPKFLEQRSKVLEPFVLDIERLLIEKQKLVAEYDANPTLKGWDRLKDNAANTKLAIDAYYDMRKELKGLNYIIEPYLPDDRQQKQQNQSARSHRKSPKSVNKKAKQTNHALEDKIVSQHVEDESESIPDPWVLEKALERDGIVKAKSRILFAEIIEVISSPEIDESSWVPCDRLVILRDNEIFLADYFESAKCHPEVQFMEPVKLATIRYHAPRVYFDDIIVTDGIVKSIPSDTGKMTYTWKRNKNGVYIYS